MTNHDEFKFYIESARIYLSESRARTKHQRAFSFWLLNAAANVRKKAVLAMDVKPAQAELF